MNSYQVQIWEISKRKDRKARPWRFRWAVDGERFEETFRTKALANSFRSELVKASNAGEPFDRRTGRPAATVRQRNQTSWYTHARAYIKMKWPRAAANSRRGIVESLTDITSVLIKSGRRGRPDPKILRKALYLYAFNPRRWNAELPRDHAAALAWVEKTSMLVVDLESPVLVRQVLDALALRKDGRPAAAATVARKRAILYNALGYAVEKELLTSNPIDRVQWKAPEVGVAIDRRVVASPEQVASLLSALALLGNRARRLVAFFACLYYAGTRPSEASDLRKSDCYLPAHGWGRITLAETAPRAGCHWTDDGKPNQRRGLKHRPRTETRPVPIPPQLVELLRVHLDLFGTAPDGRLFRGLRGGALSESTYDRWWKLARQLALTSIQVNSPLARRPYDLRHAAASLWLNAGVPPTEIARRLGHSVAVLLKVYANCVDGGDGGMNDRIGRVLG